MENKQLTAVEWLIDELGIDIFNSKPAQQALEMEKQQHKNTWDNAEPIGWCRKTFEQYYSKTYKK